ncbi:MAG TPA: HlyD family efflux transporter periplasmic adaptor subunit [Blastocatellia bacterium]|jgi:HlyD family secretion protein|nr:HlyD family efflux transporter periplasmic adaptor subunit [Blastocatellia bacterium]
MDIPRSEKVKRNKRIRRILYLALTFAVIGGATVGLSKLKPAPPSVESATVVSGEVKRGQMIRNVHGIGTLVPEEIRWISATVNGRIEKRHVKPGDTVKEDTVLIEMSNPELERDALDAQTQLVAAEAELANQRVQLRSQYLNQKAQAANVRADYSRAKIMSETDAALFKERLGSERTYKLSKSTADELAERAQIEQERLEIGADSIKAQIAIYEARVKASKLLYDLRRKQLDALKVRAGLIGVVQDVAVQEGQQVAIGANLARVADPSKLKAEIRVAETQTRDIAFGQRVEIDTRNGIVEGHVMRIAPAPTQGTLPIDVAIDGELPRGARPDMGVDGTIELERLKDALYVQRPAVSQEHSVITLFKYVEGGKEAVRVQVKLGRSSVTDIEILEGLNVGDRVILSDTSQFDAAPRIRLN